MTDRRPDSSAREDERPAFDRILSREIDRAIEQLEAATDPEVRAAWRKVLDRLEALIP
jgi:hypothetical protein